MARTSAAQLQGQDFSPEEQAQFDAMQAADNDATDAVETTETVEPQVDETAAAEATTAQQQQQRQQMVPHAALHEERERRKALDATLAEERRQRTLLEERTNLLLQRMNQQTAPAATTVQAQVEIPDLATDPVGHIVGKLRAQELELQQLRSGNQQSQQQMQAMGVAGAIQQRAQALEAQFVVEHPDYTQAVQHLMSVRNRELEAIGYRDAGERAAMIQNEGLALAGQAMQRGENPAQVLYGLAQIRGWQTPSEGAETAQATVQQNSNAEQRIAQVAAGQRQARSIANAAGSAPTAWTAEKLLRMSEKDFAAALNNPEAMALLGS